MSDKATALREILRRDFGAFHQMTFSRLEPGKAFSPNWHYRHLAYKLDQVMRGQCRRLIINVPPRSGKSMMTSVAWPMFMLGHNPNKRIMCISHTEALAREFSVCRRSIAQSAWYQALFPRMELSSSRPRDMEFRTTLRGGCFAAGVGGAVLGRGADVIVIDDPSKGIEAMSEAGRRKVTEFFDNTLITRLDEKTSGAIIIVMQRLHQDDLVGHVMARGDWEVVSLPAIAPEAADYALSAIADHVYRRGAGELLDPVRDSLEAMEEIKRAQGTLLFEAQFQQNPLPLAGNIVRRSWLRTYDARPERFDRTVVSWDTASTLGQRSDWSVGTVWGAIGLDYYLLDVRREKLEAPDLRRAIMALSAEYHADATLMEDTALGKALVQDLHRTGGLRLMLQPPRYDKQTRLLAQSARFEGGQVHLPAEAPWLAAYLEELLAFPNCQHDDQVDSTSQALTWLTARTPVQRETVRRKIENRRRIRDA